MATLADYLAQRPGWTLEDTAEEPARDDISALLSGLNRSYSQS